MAAGASAEVPSLLPGAAPHGAPGSPEIGDVMPDRDRPTRADHLQSAGLMIASVVIVAAALAPWVRTLWRMIAG